MKHGTDASRPERTAVKLIAGGSLLLLMIHTLPATAAVVVNGSFESGDLRGWDVTDLDIPLEPIGVRPRGSATAFGDFIDLNGSGSRSGAGAGVSPTDGAFALSHGFDGSGPGSISLVQDLGIVTAGDVLSFDYAIHWDLLTFSPPGPVADRTFRVRVSNAASRTVNIARDVLVVEGNTRSTADDDRNSRASHTLDLSLLTGFAATLTFEWHVPEFFTGPANAQLDNVRIVSASPGTVPEPESLLLLSFGLCVLALARSGQVFRAGAR